MAVFLQVALFALGLGFLYVGAEALVKGSVRLATSFGVRRRQTINYRIGLDLKA